MVDCGDGQIVAVCGNEVETECEDISLSPSDLVIHELDRRRLCQLSALALGVEPAFLPVEGIYETFHVGTLADVAWRRRSIYLSLEHRADRRLDMAARLSQRESGSFILLAPTPRFVTLPISETLQRSEGVFLALTDLLVAGGNGEFAIGPAVQPFLESLQPPEPDSVDAGLERFPTPSNAKWGDLRMQFLDGARLTVLCRTGANEQQRTVNYTQMGMANRTNSEPTKIWRLLEDFADGYGRIEVGSSRDDPQNRKRVQRLNEKLRAYFGMEGQPVYWDRQDSAYRCRFQIEQQ
ncbi:hypothetical protein MAIT1_04024 [Magnetofaba australis IT-1]|uniref:Uncharacterized protein n=1 Tax=Magnetofaba australis IT-1 TaxID=1434232 RepID=A0A1Y2K5C4_9PROT|nr:hypothetical protein MAIT1_04024 [Magnetofaba australis IT-1]